MAFTQAQLDALDRAIASSELEVEFPDGNRVRYASFADLKARRDFIAGDLAAVAAPRRTGFYQFNMTTLRGD